ncbi:uncharacterized protein LOC129903631 [Solanum dulcamara]|uniref:uncharacterized protein LOC129903631 n=1 Tax=Solanum dulcamara TaxID=45834 RepID=UPI00248632DD|nr:uncharacterized protein LOC129903631 [Solanum dulcamara]
MRIQGEVSSCMFFTDDIVFVDETCGDINTKLEDWRHTLESKGFKLSSAKTDYLECKFSGVMQEANVDMMLDTCVIQKRESFTYLGSIILRNRKIEEDTTHRIGAGWIKWRLASGVYMKMKVAEMRMLRWMCRHTRRDKIRNEDIRDKVGVGSVEDKTRVARLRWFGRSERHGCPSAEGVKLSNISSKKAILRSGVSLPRHRVVFLSE